MQLSSFITVDSVISEIQWTYLCSGLIFIFLEGCTGTTNEHNFLCIYNQIHFGDLRTAIFGVQKLMSGMFGNKGSVT